MMIRAVILAVALATPLAAQDSMVAAPLRLVDHGVICDVTITGEREAPLTESGVLNLIDQDREIDVTTRRVPTRLGLSFGLRMRLADGTAPIVADIVVTHPAMPSGTTVQSWQTPVTDAAVSLNVFTFESPHEMVEGRWTFVVMNDGRVLARQIFDVVRDSLAPEVLGTCFGETFSS